MTILAVVGLKREAAIVSGPEVIPVIAGNSGALRERIEAALGPHVRGIISIGIAGALAQELAAGDVIVAERVVTANEVYEADSKWTARLAAALHEARIGAILGRAAIADSASLKAALYESSRVDAVDMESHVAAAVARENALPFASLRAISDRAGHSLPPAALAAMKPNGGIALGRVVVSVLQRPQQIPALIRTGRESEKAFAALLRCVQMLGPGLGCPYLD